jgi:hypothetical protein
MANIPIWPGSSSFFPGQTPFGFYDYDYDFQTDADKVALFCTRTLGYPIQEVELQDINFYTAFEEAVTTYGNEVFRWKIRENYLSIEGASTGSNFNNQLISPTLNSYIRIADEYGVEAEVGGKVTLHSGSVTLRAGVQVYDLNEFAVSQSISGGIEVRRVFYQEPPAILRYFDPYAGTGTGVQSLLSTFGFGTFSPAVNFLLMPIYFDVLKIQAIEFNDQIRKSAYSFELQNNQLRIFPVPKQDHILWFQYYKNDDKANPIRNTATNLVTNVGEVPYQNPVYSHINSVGRQWIFQYTLALVKMNLAYVRGKYGTVPIPGSEVTLNQSDLLTDGRQERDYLLTQLREMLDQTSRQAQLDRRRQETENLNTTLNSVPLPIYIG